MAIRPGRRLIQCLLAWAALGALPLVARAWLPELTLAALLAWLGAGLAGALWALNDARRLRARPMPIAERRLPAALSVGVAESGVLHLHGEGRDEHWPVADHPRLGPGKLIALLRDAGYGRRRVAFFGLPFKSGTDDMRGSPFVSLA